MKTALILVTLIVLTVGGLMIPRGVDLGTTAPDPQLTGYFKSGNSPRPDTEWYDEKGNYDYIHLTPGAWELNHMIGALDSLRLRNPEINIGTYVPLFSCPQWMADADTTRFPGRWWRELSPLLARTTEGDTASLWVKSYVWDIVNPKARALAIHELSRYVREQGLEHAMLDWASVPMANLLQFQPQWWQDLVHGDLDFDRDGIGHWDDPDEQEMLRQVFYDYMEELRAALPENFMLIPNGSLAIKDTQFAQLVDGCYVENFPSWHFGSTEPNYQLALDPEYPNSLWHLTAPDRWHGGKGTVMLENKYDQLTISYIAHCFDGAVDLRREIDAHPPEPISLGLPLSAATIKDWQLRRYYERGVIGVNIIRPDRVMPYIQQGD